MVIIVVSLPCTAYHCGSLIVLQEPAVFNKASIAIYIAALFDYTYKAPFFPLYIPYQRL